jgi:hypothetical protein
MLVKLGENRAWRDEWVRPWGPWRTFRGLLLVVAGLLLATCSRGGAPAFPAQPTQAEALSKVLNHPVHIAYSEPFGQGRALVLFRTDTNPGLSPTVLEQTGLGQWRMTDAVSLRPSLRGLGALTYDQAGVGRVETQMGSVTSIQAEAAVLYGEILNPAIAWVDVTLVDGEAQTLHADVKNGIWLVKMPGRNTFPEFTLTAGNTGGRLLAVTMDDAPRDNPGEVAEFDDRLSGILFRSRYARFPGFDGERFQFGFPDGSLSIKRSQASGKALRDLQARFLAAPPAEGTKVTVLEQGTRRLGGHDAAFVRLSTEGPGENRRNAAVYFVVTPDADYEVTCASLQVKNPLPWDDLQPRCDQVLEGLRLGR